MITDGVVKSSCDLCSTYCGTLVHLENGRVANIEGDPESPVNKGSLCAKGRASLEYVYHPERLKHPLKRLGDRGEGKWRRISWDDALNLVANELLKARDNYGTESLAFISGARKGLSDDFATRLANVLGTPNRSSAAYTCFAPRLIASTMTCGFLPFPDYEYPSKCILVWGADASQTCLSAHVKTIQAAKKGARVIVINPLETKMNRKADLWLRVKPGSDLALALGMIHIIINEELFDRAFVERWTVGFDELKAHVRDYSPDRVEALTWVNRRMIQKAARLYAKNKPACVQWGNGVEHNEDGFQTCRAISILRAITGNLGRPGGESEWLLSGLPSAQTPGMLLKDRISADMRKRRLGEGYMMPSLSFVLPQVITKAILGGKPYPVRAAYIQSSNPILTWPNARETFEALTRLDFLVVADMFMTPTAHLADIVLPVAATYLEYDSIVCSAYDPIAQIQQKVINIGECRSDFEILNELAKKMGVGAYFWNDTEQFLDTVLEPLGLTFENFRKVGVIRGVKLSEYNDEKGFATPSRKVELYSKRLKDWGFDPLPTYRGNSNTAFIGQSSAEEYPLLLTNGKSVYYRHSQGRQIASLRDRYPDPLVVIHQDTAHNLGIENGDWIYIETSQGRIKQRAVLSGCIDPRVVNADFGWWHPEHLATNLSYWSDTNINVLISNTPLNGREIGTPNLRGVPCKISRVL